MTIDKKRRHRHVASDEAHAWARSLPLNNPNGKTVLRALALYVNGEGTCFVGVDQLAEDTDLSADTVRRRLVWLEQIGAIVRLAQWIDENGRRNGEGRGKRTSDEIRLLLQANIDDIERAARGDVISEPSDNSSTETTPISPSTQQGLNEEPESVSPQLAPRQPSQSCEGLISEPEPEDSPPPPLRGEALPEDWKDFESEWAEPILRQSLAQQVWSSLTPAERTLARQAARGYRLHRQAQKRPPTILAAHRFLKERDAWARFAAIAPDVHGPTTGSYDPDSREGRAIVAMHAVAKVRPREARGMIVYRGEITPQILAFADAPDVRTCWIEQGRQIAAWSNFLKDHIKIPRPTLVGVREDHYADRTGIYAPWPWPPSVEGKIYAESTGPPETLASEDDLADFK